MSVSTLSGGLTADMDRLTITTASGEYDVVLRRWARRRWGTGLVEREAAGLDALLGHELPVPRLLAADQSGDLAGEPCLLMTALPGQPMLRPPNVSWYVAQLATTLVRLHEVAPTDLAPTDPHGFDERTVDAWITDKALAAVVKEAASDASTRSHPVLVHGDYQSLNTLWQGQTLSGVVDWTYAGIGCRETDVGLCRLSLAVLVSVEAAEAFLRRYEIDAGVRIDPRADLRAMSAFGPSWLGFVASQLDGSRPVDQRAMAGRVEDLLRTSAARLG